MWENVECGFSLRYLERHLTILCSFSAIFTFESSNPIRRGPSGRDHWVVTRLRGDSGQTVHSRHSELIVRCSELWWGDTVKQDHEDYWRLQIDKLCEINFSECDGIYRSEFSRDSRRGKVKGSQTWEHVDGIIWTNLTSGDWLACSSAADHSCTTSTYLPRLRRLKRGNQVILKVWAWTWSILERGDWQHVLIRPRQVRWRFARGCLVEELNIFSSRAMWISMIEVGSVFLLSLCSGTPTNKGNKSKTFLAMDWNYWVYRGLIHPRTSLRCWDWKLWYLGNLYLTTDDIIVGYTRIWRYSLKSWRRYICPLRSSGLVTNADWST